MPKISVVSTVRNGSEHVGQVAGSVLGQEFTDYEWLILDDRSTDGTASMLADLEAEHSAVTVLTPDERLGRARGLNRVVEAAAGEYVAQQDFDDVRLPECPK
jgi:glycosyltransferase involved in cell wall biosynthesis